MQIVINIPEEMKSRFCCDRPDLQDIKKICHIISNGSILPEKHGRLIDADELIKELKGHKYSNTFCLEHSIDWSIDLGMAILLTNDAQTLVKAEDVN